ncbi:MAG: hypothetical protein LUQ42_05580 [Methanomicrobiales archaeon]|jgi:hypothetical protein|nr:hypothetical protein [Methanomicrobiales archaeon]
MSSEDNFLEKYLDEKKSPAQFLKEPKSWVIIVTVLAIIFALYAVYRFVIVDRMSPQEVKDSIQVLDLESKWVEKEVSAEGVKIVPVVTFKIKNIGKRELEYVNLEGIFEFEETGKPHSDGFDQIGKEPLLPGQVSRQIVIKSNFGYTGSSKEAFIINKDNWQKMYVRIYANTRGSGHVRIVEKFPIKQEIAGLEAIQDSRSKEEKEKLDQNTEKFARSIAVAEQESKWLDRKITENEAVIVPSITVKIKNLAAAPIQDIVFRGVFLFEESEDWLSDGIARALEKPLPPGATSDDILIKAENGYKASSKAAFIKNKELWKKVKVKLYAKAADSEYALIGVYPISQDIQGVRVIYRFK